MARDDPHEVRRPLRCPDVLHTITGLNFGGAEMMLLRLLSGIDRRREHQRVLSLLEPGKLAPSIASLPVRIETLGMTRGLPGPGSLLRLARLPRAARPELLQGWMYHGNLAATALRMRGFGEAGMVWSVHHTLTRLADEKPLTQRLIGLSARLSHRADAIVYVSETSARQHEALGFDSSRTIIIPNGVDAEVFAPDADAAARLRLLANVPAGRLIVGNAARLHPMKDHAGLIRAAGQAVAAGADIHLVLIGEGVASDHRPIAAALAESGLGDRVSFLGLREDMAALMPGFDIYVSASAFGESFPVVVAEAMAAGVPCIVTDLGDCALLVGLSGTVVAPSDPNALSSALVDLAGRSPDARRQSGAAARARIIESFTIAGVVDRYRQLHAGIAARQVAAT